MIFDGDSWPVDSEDGVSMANDANQDGVADCKDATNRDGDEGK